MKRLIYDMYYRDEISTDVAARLLNKLEELRNKKRR
jgi:hypothetical protein